MPAKTIRVLWAASVLLLTAAAPVRAGAAEDDLDLGRWVRPAPTSARFVDPDWYIW